MQEESPFPDEKTRTNEVLMYLHKEGPATANELPRDPNLRERRWMGTFDVTRSGTGASKSRGRTTSVYYLYGDERRAVRRYIQENEDFVRSCMDDKVNPINMGMEDYWWQMFCEEWVWGDYGDDS